MSGSRRVPRMAHCAAGHRAGEGRRKGTGRYFKRRFRKPGFRATGFSEGHFLESSKEVSSAFSASPPEKVDHKNGCRYQNDNARARGGSCRPALLIFLGTEPLCEGIQVLLHGSCEERVH